MSCSWHMGTLLPKHQGTQLHHGPVFPMCPGPVPFCKRGAGLGTSIPRWQRCKQPQLQLPHALV